MVESALLTPGGKRGKMAVSWYVPAGVTKAVVVVIAVHVVLGLVNPPVLSALLERYSMIVRMLVSFLAGLPR